MRKFNVNDEVICTFHGAEILGHVTSVYKMSTGKTETYGYSVEFFNGTNDSFIESELMLTEQ